MRRREICRYYEASLLTIVESLSSLGDDIPLAYFVSPLIAVGIDSFGRTQTLHGRDKQIHIREGLVWVL